MDEPQKLRPWEIKRLTPRQTFDVYGRPRDKDGRPLPMAKTPTSPEAETAMFLALGKALIKGGAASFTEEELLARAEKARRERTEQSE